MSLALLAAEPVGPGVRRVLSSCVDRAREVLSSPEVTRERAVHETRKRLKELRALLRLVRDVLGRGAQRALDRQLAAVARVLAEDRDRAVAIESLQQLAATADTAQRAVDALRSELEAEHAAAEGAPTLERVRAELDALAETLAALPLDPPGFEAIERGLRRVYREGRDRFAHARARQDAEALHEWRKRVKDLWYAVQLVEASFPELLGPTAQQLHALSDHLGTDHDLSLLEPLLDDRLSGDELRAAQHALAGRRAAHQHAAVALGERLFAEEPRAFTARLGAYWRAPATRP